MDIVFSTFKAAVGLGSGAVIGGGAGMCYALYNGGNLIYHLGVTIISGFGFLFSGFDQDLKEACIDNGRFAFEDTWELVEKTFTCCILVPLSAAYDLDSFFEHLLA